MSFEVPADFPGTSERLVGILFLYTVSLASWKVVHSAYYKLCIYTGIKTCWTFCYKTEMLSKKNGKRNPLSMLSFRSSPVVLPAVPSQHCPLEEHLCGEGHSKP